jgi:hypothetical protein
MESSPKNASKPTILPSFRIKIKQCRTFHVSSLFASLLDHELDVEVVPNFVVAHIHFTFFCIRHKVPFTLAK